jgi:hypothetical protein
VEGGNREGKERKRWDEKTGERRDRDRDQREKMGRRDGFGLPNNADFVSAPTCLSLMENS